MDNDYVDFGLIELNRISFHTQIGTANTLIRHGRGEHAAAINESVAAAASLLEELERDYARDLANMRRRLDNVTAGRAMDDNG